MIKRTFYPVGVHLNDLVHELDRMTAFPLRFPDLLRISTLTIYEASYVECHGGKLMVYVEL